jgi:hypothetical protein
MWLCYASSWSSSISAVAQLIGPWRAWLVLARKTITKLLVSTAFLIHPLPCHHYVRHVNQDSDMQTMEDPASGPSNETRRRPESIDVSRILLQSGPNSPRQPPPAERISSSPTTRASLDSVRTCTSSISHSRSMSLIDNPRKNKRLSLSFPIQQPNSRPSRPPSWANAPLKSPVDIPSPTEGNFLTILASQERRVLELKDELRQAELELERLKKHFSLHEAGKKRSDIRKVQQLQPLVASLSTIETAEEDEDGSSEWLQKEMERRKVLLRGIKTSNRKVFSGSRHTRTLSLLSPEKSTFSQPFPQPAETRRSDSVSSRPPPSNRSSTISEFAISEIAETPAPSTTSAPPQLDGTQTKEALMRTGKQMAVDLKDGLMTFFEDIRQATVGDEGGTIRATQGQGRQSTRTARGGRPGQLNRTNSARSTRGRDSRHDTLIDIGGSFWRDHGMGMDSPNHKPASRSASKSMSAKREATPIKTDTDNDWDNWGTPIKRTPSALSPDPSDEGSSTSSQSDNRSTPLTSAGGHDSPVPSAERALEPHSASRPSTETKRDSIPWPNLEKLPSNLKRTASHLMKEWEKSMSPSRDRVGAEHDSDSGLDYPVPSPLTPGHSRSQSVSPALATGKMKVKKAD